MNPEQLKAFINDRSIHRYLYINTAKGVFDDVDGKSLLNKQEFIMLYNNFTEADKEQVEALLSIGRNNVNIDICHTIATDARGTYCAPTIETRTVKHEFKVYGPIDFLTILGTNYMDGAYDCPGFTLEELYQEALK